MDVQQELTGAAPLADALAATLSQEQDAVIALRGWMDQQLEALRVRDGERIETTAIEANRAAATLARLRQTRERQSRLLARVLGAGTETVSIREIVGALESRAAHAAGERLGRLREALVREAAETQRRCEEVDFALRYAHRLGEDLLKALRGLDAPAAGAVYTARGGTAGGYNRPLVNRMA